MWCVFQDSYSSRRPCKTHMYHRQLWNEALMKASIAHRKPCPAACLKLHLWTAYKAVLFITALVTAHRATQMDEEVTQPATWTNLPFEDSIFSKLEECSWGIHHKASESSDICHNSQQFGFDQSSNRSITQLWFLGGIWQEQRCLISALESGINRIWLTPSWMACTFQCVYYQHKRNQINYN